MSEDELLEAAHLERDYARRCADHAIWLESHNYRAYASDERRIAAEALERAAEYERAASMTTPADEVDGFRAGDLVALNPDGYGAWGRVVSADETQVTVRYPDKADLRFHPLKDTRRKPVEVGDTVRHINGSPLGVVVEASPHNFEVRKNALEQYWLASEVCIAIKALDAGDFTR